MQDEEKRQKSGWFSFFVEAFLKVARLYYSKSTISLFANVFKTFLKTMGDMRIPLMTTRDAEVFKAERIKQVSAETLNIEIRTLKAAFSHGKKIGLIDGNPFQETKKIRHKKREAEFLKLAQFQGLILVIDDLPFAELVKFAILTMMRRSEIVNLRNVDVDLARRVIYVRPHGDFEPKSKKPRDIPMNEWVFRFLSSKPAIGEYVFTDRLGRQLNAGTITHRFKKYARKAGLSERIRFHSLRHTGISWLINNGVPQPFVQRIAGHSSIAVTQIYTHLEDQNLVKAVDSFPTMN